MKISWEDRLVKLAAQLFKAGFCGMLGAFVWQFGSSVFSLTSTMLTLVPLLWFILWFSGLALLGVGVLAVIAALAAGSFATPNSATNTN